MSRLPVGSLVAGAAMWVMGFIFYGLMFDFAFTTAPEATNLSIQAALKALPHSGNYIVPMGETPAMAAAYQAGPVATISYNARGSSMSDPMVFIGGLVHFVVVAAMIGLLLANLGERVTSFSSRASVVLGVAAVVVVYSRLLDPIWYRGDWRHAAYVALADFVILASGGLIMARWFARRAG